VLGIFIGVWSFLGAWCFGFGLFYGISDFLPINQRFIATIREAIPLGYPFDLDFRQT
jgi:hypothetical protein